MNKQPFDYCALFSGTALASFTLACVIVAGFFWRATLRGIPITIANKPEVRFIHEHVFLPGEVAEVQPNGQVKLRHPADGEVQP